MFYKNRNHHYLKLFMILVVFSLILFVNCSEIEISRFYQNGAVASSAPIASDLGLKVLQDGGNAFDAAVAVGFALAVVHPEAGNIGGGGFALIRDGNTGEIKALDFREKAPQAAFETMYLDEQGNPLENASVLGAKASGVPGTVAGLYDLWEKYGSKDWEELISYAAALADTGFIVDDYLSSSLKRNRESLSIFDQTRDIFYPDGNPPAAGSKLYQEKLSKALYMIAAGGKKGFYESEIADSLVQTMVDNGGLITKEDLLSYQTTWRDPIKFSFDSFTVYSMPLPSSGGIVLGQILKLLEPYDFSLYTTSSPEYIHLFTEASKLAFADRAELLGDPDFVHVNSSYLLSEEYLDNRRALIKKDIATPSSEISSGLVAAPKESDQTTHFSIYDNSGNAVSITYTLNTSYGSKLMVNGFGILLNNEMDDFSIKPGVPNSYGLVGSEANKVEGGKRMLSSMSPTIVLKENKPFLVLGSPGGSKIITTVAKAILDICRFNLSPKETAALPRFHHQWLPDKLYLEKDRFDINQKQTLISFGQNVTEREPYSDLQLLLIDNNLVTGASDPRNRGTVAGY